MSDPLDETTQQHLKNLEGKTTWDKMRYLYPLPSYELEHLSQDSALCSEVRAFCEGPEHEKFKTWKKERQKELDADMNQEARDQLRQAWREGRWVRVVDDPLR